MTMMTAILRTFFSALGFTLAVVLSGVLSRPRGLSVEDLLAQRVVNCTAQMVVTAMMTTATLRTFFLACCFTLAAVLSKGFSRPGGLSVAIN